MRDTNIIRLCLRGIALLAIFTLLSCVGLPVQEMSDARQAITSAKEMQADKYAKTTLEQARNLLLSAEEELDVGNYSAARDSALAAKDRAIEARAKAISQQGDQ